MVYDTSYELATRAYGDYSNMHAILLLHVIHARALEPISPPLVEQIAKAMIYCGDYMDDHPEELVLPQTISFIRTLLDRTTLPRFTSVEEAIQSSCTNPSSIPVICPATTVMSAVFYLNRYLQKFGMFTHSYYAAQRLFLVAYLVAAKFIHANMKFLVTQEHILEEDHTVTQLLGQMGTCFMADHSINPDQLCSMEMEFLHFMDYQLRLGPSTPLQLWSWFYATLEKHSQSYHAIVRSRS